MATTKSTKTTAATVTHYAIGLTMRTACGLEIVRGMDASGRKSHATCAACKRAIRASK